MISDVSGGTLPKFAEQEKVIDYEVKPLPLHTESEYQPVKKSFNHTATEQSILRDDFTTEKHS